MLDSKDEKSEEKINDAVAENISKPKESKKNNTETEPNEAENKAAENDENTTKAIEDVENKVAEKAEKDDEKPTTPKIDYSKLELEELVDELEKLIKNNPIQQIKTNAEAIKNTFNLKFGKLLADKKEAFLAEGGNSIDFQFSSLAKTRYNKLLSEYKKQKDTHYSTLEKQLKENLEKRIRVIEDLKLLISNADTKTMYKLFRDLQNRWKLIGPVPKNNYNDTWKTYHHHVERFYDLLHLSNDFRDLDFKNNLEEKLKLVQKAEELTEEKNVNLAFRELQKLHKHWKEDIGPVANDMREEIWNKFSEATKKVHNKRHHYFREMKSQYREIIDKKMAIIDEINNFDFSKNNTYFDWQNSVKDIEALRQKYFDAGKLPYSKGEPLWKKFKAAQKQFNQAKKSFYKEEKKSHQENLEKKLKLIELAVSLQDTENCESATNAFKKIQSDWKKIGHVPRKFSDDVWQKFKTACNHYFNRYRSQKNSLSTGQQEIVSKKSQLLYGLKVKNYKTKEAIEELINEWFTLGRLPKSSRNIDAKFNKFIIIVLDKLTINKEEIAMLKFKNVINGYLVNNDTIKIDSEQLFIRAKIDESTRKIQQLENNLSFISNPSDNNPLVKNVHNSIAKFKLNLKIWKQKLEYLRVLDY